MVVVLGFVIMLLIGVPIAWVLGATGLIHILTTGDLLLLDNLAQRMFNGINMFGLLAVPLFMLAGDLMNSGGLTLRLADLARSMVGHLRGGLAHVTTLVAMFLAAIVGSSTAVTAVTCKTLVPEMIKDGYDDDFAAALSAAASIIGPIIPPSMIFVVYGVTAGVSVGAMFIAGILPGILLGLSFMLLSYFIARKRNYPVGERSSFKQFWAGFKSSFPALLLPIIVLGGLLTGAVSPTETAGLAVLVSFIVGKYIYKDLKWKQIPGILQNTAITSSSILIIIAAANIFGWTLAIEQVPQLIANALLGFTTNSTVIILIIIAFLMFVGCIMETFAAIIILVPVFMPILSQIGMDPLHFAMVVSVTLIVGLMTPPVGMDLFVANSITGVSFERISRAVVPFVGAAIIVVLMIAFIPQISLWLPSIAFSK